MRLACPDPDCAAIADPGETVCPECGSRLLPGSTIGGYRYLHLPWHRLARTGGQVAEHRMAAEIMLGRPLEPGEVVHHINGDTTDNREENLIVFASAGDHARHHWALRRIARAGMANGASA